MFEALIGVQMVRFFDTNRIKVVACINKPEVISKIKEAFELQDYTIEFDNHYRCRNCISDLDTLMKAKNIL